MQVGRQRAPVDEPCLAGGVALGLTPFGEAELKAGPKVRVVARQGVGYDAVDVAALTRGLGEEWATHRIMLKRFPVHITSHTSVQAVQDLRREHGYAGACQRKKIWNGTPHENILAAADAAYG